MRVTTLSVDIKSELSVLRELRYTLQARFVFAEPGIVLYPFHVRHFGVIVVCLSQFFVQVIKRHCVVISKPSEVLLKV